MHRARSWTKSSSPASQRRFAGRGLAIGPVKHDLRHVHRGTMSRPQYVVVARHEGAGSARAGRARRRPCRFDSYRREGTSAAGPTPLGRLRRRCTPPSPCPMIRMLTRAAGRIGFGHLRDDSCDLRKGHPRAQSFATEAIEAAHLSSWANHPHRSKENTTSCHEVKSAPSWKVHALRARVKTHHVHASSLLHPHTEPFWRA